MLYKHGHGISIHSRLQCHYDKLQISGWDTGWGSRNPIYFSDVDMRQSRVEFWGHALEDRPLDKEYETYTMARAALI